MSIEYSVVENNLSKSGTYMAKVITVDSSDMAAIIDKMSEMGSTVTKADILAVLNVFFKVIIAELREGRAINLSFMHIHFSITGVFTGASDSHDSSRHKVHIKIISGKELDNAVLPNVHLKKVEDSDHNPHMLEVIDVSSGTTDSQISAGGALKILGKRLKIDGPDASNGLAFIAADGTVTPVATIIDNEPSKLIVTIPQLTAGTYHLQLTTQYSGSGAYVLNKPRTATFGKTLTIV